MRYLFLFLSMFFCSYRFIFAEPIDSYYDNYSSNSIDTITNQYFSLSEFRENEYYFRGYISKDSSYTLLSKDDTCGITISKFTRSRPATKTEDAFLEGLTGQKRASRVTSYKGFAGEQAIDFHFGDIKAELHGRGKCILEGRKIIKKIQVHQRYIYNSTPANYFSTIRQRADAVVSTNYNTTFIVSEKSRYIATIMDEMTGFMYYNHFFSYLVDEGDIAQNLVQKGSLNIGYDFLSYATIRSTSGKYYETAIHRGLSGNFILIRTETRPNVPEILDDILKQVDLKIGVTITESLEMETNTIKPPSLQELLESRSAYPL